MSSGVRGRQRWRRALLLIAFILFPVTMNYFSPYLIVAAAFEGVVSGSLVVFAAMFLAALVLGRLWCGWACPAAGPQEFARPVNGRAPRRVAGLVKWVIWVPWVGLIISAALSAGGYTTIDLAYGTEAGISLAGSAERPIMYAYAVYFGVVALFIGLAMAVGRRGGCRTVCWMAPFMILGRRLGTLLRLPAVRLQGDASHCIACGTCTRECPMGLPVQSMVASGRMDHDECVLCCTCADACPQQTITLTVARPNRPAAASRRGS